MSVRGHLFFLCLFSIYIFFQIVSSSLFEKSNFFIPEINCSLKILIKIQVSPGI